MKAIVSWTLKTRKVSTVWWVVGIMAFVFVTLIFYPTIHHQQAQLEKSFSDLSSGTVALFSDTGDIFSPDGYLSSQIFYLLMPLLLGILAIGLGASLVGREEKEGTLELILSRPISRGKLLASKVTAGIVIVVAVGMVGSVFTAVMSKLVSLPVPFWNILLTGVTATMLALSFGAISFMVASLGRTARGAAVGIAALVAIAGYLLSSLAAQVSWLNGPSKALPFAYYHPADVLNGTYNWLNLLFMIGVIVACGMVSYFAFRRRDLVGS